MLEVVYELLTEDQRKELHLRAAKYYDTSIIRCGIHGGDDTAYQFGFTVKGSADVGADHVSLPLLHHFYTLYTKYFDWILSI